MKQFKDSSLLFENYPWPSKGARRCEIEAWLRATTKYSSNRAMQTIINTAVEQGVIKKNLNTRKYHPGK
jgi:hypothetical protein